VVALSLVELVLAATPSWGGPPSFLHCMAAVCSALASVGAPRLKNKAGEIKRFQDHVAILEHDYAWVLRDKVSRFKHCLSASRQEDLHVPCVKRISISAVSSVASCVLCP
jgi:hypothetical protein